MSADDAMEFLFTYGWAILVVLAALGALSYFELLRPEGFLPDENYDPDYDTCEEWTFTCEDLSRCGIIIQPNTGYHKGSIQFEKSEKLDVLYIYGENYWLGGIATVDSNETRIFLKEQAVCKKWHSNIISAADKEQCAIHMAKKTCEDAKMNYTRKVVSRDSGGIPVCLTRNGDEYTVGQRGWAHYDMYYDLPRACT